jgi:hypothetical protein
MNEVTAYTPLWLFVTETKFGCGLWLTIEKAPWLATLIVIMFPTQVAAIALEFCCVTCG